MATIVIIAQRTTDVLYGSGAPKKSAINSQHVTANHLRIRVRMFSLHRLASVAPCMLPLHLPALSVHFKPANKPQPAAQTATDTEVMYELKVTLNTASQASVSGKSMTC